MDRLCVVKRGESGLACLILGYLLATSGCTPDSASPPAPKSDAPAASDPTSKSGATSNAKNRRDPPPPDAADLEGRAGRPRGR
jgi:hypothetical protein